MLLGDGRTEVPRYDRDDRRTKEPVKKLTAEIAETAEKKILRFLGELCALCGKTSHFS